MTKITAKFDAMYDTYCLMLYDIALQIAPSKKEADQILIATFSRAHEQNIENQIYPSPCILLLKLLIETAQELLANNSEKTNFIIKQFKNTPMLHYLICEQKSFENYCAENHVAKELALKKFRLEFSGLTGVKIAVE